MIKTQVDSLATASYILSKQRKEKKQKKKMEWTSTEKK